MQKVKTFSLNSKCQYFTNLISEPDIITYPLYDDSIPKTAFTSPFRKYEYLKIPFGLAKMPVYFQELMNKVLKDLPFTNAYLDDIIFYSQTAETSGTLQQVFINFTMQKYP